MAYLTVGGVDVNPVENGGQAEYTEIGTRTGSASGAPAAAIRTRKRAFRITTAPLDDTALSTLRTALNAAPPVALTGTWQGGSINVFPLIEKEAPVSTAPPTTAVTFRLDEA